MHGPETAAADVLKHSKKTNLTTVGFKDSA